MSRPKRKRFISQPPIMEGFRPFGVPAHNLEPIILLFEEFEAFRQVDYLGKTHAEASEEMGISRPTLTRIYDQARRTIAEAFVLGKAVIIEGGDFMTHDFWYRCKNCSQLIISYRRASQCSSCHSPDLRHLTSQSTKLKNMSQQETTGHCVCPHCDTRIIHKPGHPCRQEVCPACGKKMVREGSYHHQLIQNKKGAKNHEDRHTK
ncbi:MAG: DUF134 domain-containing protein [Bacteroidales bacterium]|nr:DUF134 domain-containing protein [Bacteroidales bacterium]